MNKINKLVLLITVLSILDPTFEFIGLGDTNCDNLKLTNGTTVGIDKIFIGRCYYFLNLLHKTNCDITIKKLNCDEIWKAFSEAILGKDPCQITENDFSNFIKLADHPIPPNKSLFWSGTSSTVHAYTHLNNHFWTLEDTLIGFLANELTFCSSKNKGFDYASCPFSCIYANNPFWNAASKNFASKASENIQIFLNGSRPEAITKESTFYRFELPNFSYKVKNLKVYLLHQPDGPKYETCANGATLNQLKTTLKSKNIGYSCVDDPAKIVYYVCFENPNSKECKVISNFFKYE